MISGLYQATAAGRASTTPAQSDDGVASTTPTLSDDGVVSVAPPLSDGGEGEGGVIPDMVAPLEGRGSVELEEMSNVSDGLDWGGVTAADDDNAANGLTVPRATWCGAW